MYTQYILFLDIFLFFFVSFICFWGNLCGGVIETLSLRPRLIFWYELAWPTRNLPMFLCSITKLNRLFKSYFNLTFTTIKKKLKGRLKRYP